VVNLCSQSLFSYQYFSWFLKLFQAKYTKTKEIFDAPNKARFLFNKWARTFDTILWLGLAWILNEPGVDTLFAFSGVLYLFEVKTKFIAILTVNLRKYLGNTKH
jgi:hypothetical protein